MSRIMSSNSKPYLSNFSSIYSPNRTDNGSILQSTSKSSFKKQTSTFMSKNEGKSLLSKGRKQLQNSHHKGESTNKLLKNKFISLTVVKNPTATKKIVRNTKAMPPKQ